MEQSTCGKACAMQMCSNSHAMQRQTPLLMVPNKSQLSVKQVPLSAKLSPFSSPFPPLEVYYSLNKPLDSAAAMSLTQYFY